MDFIFNQKRTIFTLLFICYSALCFRFHYIHLEQILLIFVHKDQELLKAKIYVFMPNFAKRKAQQRIEISKLIFRINDFGINVFRNRVGSCKLMRKETLHMNQDRSLNGILSVIPSIKCESVRVAAKWLQVDGENRLCLSLLITGSIAR